VAIFEGTTANDTISGGTTADQIMGDAGDDFISSGAGDDVLFGGDGIDILLADLGNDVLVGGNGVDYLVGSIGADTLSGGAGDDYLQGGANAGPGLSDSMTGGAGKDVFAFFADSLTDNSVTAGAIGTSGIRGRNLADAVTDFTFGDDKVMLHLSGFGINAPITMVSGSAADLTTNGNFIVATSPFANAGAAAAAIAANANITSSAGFFIYFNSTLGFNRLVHSADLANGGEITILANFTSLSGDAGLTAMANWGTDDFLFL
jgi:Ca2+-binding RTX toxin-like protein